MKCLNETAWDCEIQLSFVSPNKKSKTNATIDFDYYC